MTNAKIELRVSEGTVGRATVVGKELAVSLDDAGASLILAVVGVLAARNTVPGAVLAIVRGSAFGYAHFGIIVRVVVLTDSLTTSGLNTHVADRVAIVTL